MRLKLLSLGNGLPHADRHGRRISIGLRGMVRRFPRELVVDLVLVIVIVRERRVDLGRRQVILAG